MKYSIYILFSLLAVGLLWACKDDELGPVVNLNGAPQLTAPTAGASFTLLEAEADSTLPAFTWTAANFGFDAGISYSLQVDKAGNNFAQPVTLGTVNGLTLDNLTQGALNNILLAKELPEDVPSDLELRVVAKVSDDVSTLISNVVTISATPYASTVVVPQLQVPGSYQGWDPANNSTVIFSPNSDGKYEGYVFISPDDQKYKFTQGLSWDVNWGDDGNDGTLQPGGADIPAAVAGVYKLNVDLNALTHTQLRTDWGLVGSATGSWDVDQDMTYDAGTGKITITLDLVAGEIKFRANDAWALNYGDNGANKTLEFEGANIVIAEDGNYTIDLLIVGVSKYKYEITKN